MKILYLAHRIPYPPNKGDKIRSFNQVRHLGASHNVDLICLSDHPGEEKYQSDLSFFCRRVFVHPINSKWAKARGLIKLAAGGTVSVGYFYRHEVQEIVDRWILENDYDAIVCFSSTMAEYVLRSGMLKRSSSREIKQPKLIMDFCDVDSDKWIQYAKDSAFPMKSLYRAEGERMLKYEGEINRRFDHSIFITQQEADLFTSLYPAAKNLEIIRNGVDFEYFSPGGAVRDAGLYKRSEKQSEAINEATKGSDLTSEQRERSTALNLLFTGAMNYHANVDGVCWFCNEIYPAFRKELDASEFYIVGSNPSPRVRELGGVPGVKVTGFVEDIRPYYQSADLSVIPLRLARGVQNKVLEAMAMGKAVVTTSKAAAGIQAIGGEHVWVEDTAEGFAGALLALSRDAEARQQLGESARKFVTEKFDWSVNMDRFETLLVG